MCLDYPVISTAAVSRSKPYSLKALWQECVQNSLQPCHYAAMLLDSNNLARDFVQTQQALPGSLHDHTRGNRTSLYIEIQFLLNYSDRDVPADRIVLGMMQKNKGSIS